jgi:lysophospholipase
LCYGNAARHDSEETSVLYHCNGCGCPLSASLVSGNAATAPGMALDELEAIESPKPSDFSSEDTILDRYDSILDFYNTGTGGTITGVVGVKLNYRVFKVSGSKRSIVLIPGRNEPILKYAEMIQDLTNMGYNIYALDPRGQGASARMLSDPNIGYVEFFKDYIDDLDLFVNQIVLKDQHDHLFVMAHSMGSAISLMYLHKHPEVFEAAVVNSPMIGVNTAPYPFSVAAALGYTNCGWGDGKVFALGQKPFDYDITQDVDAVTHSKNRFSAKMKLYSSHKDQIIGGVSYRWLCQAMIEGSELTKIADKVNKPILMFQAEDELIVDPEGGRKFCDRAPKCMRKVYAGGWHETFMETDDRRNDALALSVRFFDFFSGGR